MKVIASRSLFALGLSALCLGPVLAAPMPAPTSIELPGDRVFPENVTSSKDGTIYVGSLGMGGVLRIEPHNAKAEVWIKPGALGLRSTFGLLADDKSGTLWVCSNDLSGLGVPGGSGESGSYLKGYDLHTGAGKVSVKFPGDKTLCNDIAVGPDGAVYVTNTMAPQILRLPHGGREFEVWSSDPLLAPPGGGGAGLDGLAFLADGSLIVDTYTPGEVFRIDVKDGKAGKVTKLVPSRKLVLADAIRPLGHDTFLIIEGGGRLDRMVVKGDTAEIETLKDGYDIPTGVAVVGKTAWVAEGQLSFVFDPSKKGQTPKPFHIYSVPLK